MTNQARKLADDATELASWDNPWSASVSETADGQIVYLSDGQDSEVYPNRQAAIDAQAQFLASADSDSAEERSWARMAQQIVDALKRPSPALPL